MVSKIKSEITNSDFKIYSIENTFNEPYKSKITEETMNKLLSEKAENKLIRDADLTLATSVFIVSEKDETEFFIYRITRKDKECNRAMTLQCK
ncbi:hypothetical protein F1B92_04300 [Campylobacter sp. FMV-PI01]|uniref:Uncharacterized protein n=1 Tax=Campylobacter portucalensis TaxID=2608384 RepID=A0A6L5WGU5_9BACT|nr:hypothetical protein [Campylobacter portucalensis]MSN96408.1 hypothetical protein [Campylobacter portucalensis]